MLSLLLFKSNVAPLATDTAVAPNALFAPNFNVPAFIVVAPVYELVPDNINVPEPILVSAPVVEAAEPVTVNTVAPVLTSIELVVPFVSVKLRSVLAVPPVYCSVPPPSTKFAAALVAAPKFPAAPPAPIVPTERTPALIVVTPV